jgi:ATP adenylyltransferase
MARGSTGRGARSASGAGSRSGTGTGSGPFDSASPRATLRSGRTDPRPQRKGSGSGSAGRGLVPRRAEPAVPQRLWAPWRLEFIQAPKPEGCIFCRFPAEPEAHDRQNLVVHRGARSFAVLNRYPYNSGHLMVVPYAHVADLDALASEEFHDLHEELRLAARVLRATYQPEGINVGMNLGRVAGAGIADHLHYHLVPRWNGDTNFMPVLADTRVIVEHLDGAWQRLRAGFERA